MRWLVEPPVSLGDACVVPSTALGDVLSRPFHVGHTESRGGARPKACGAQQPQDCLGLGLRLPAPTLPALGEAGTMIWGTQAAGETGPPGPSALVAGVGDQGSQAYLLLLVAAVLGETQRDHGS